MDDWKRDLQVGVAFIDTEHNGLITTLEHLAGAAEACRSDPGKLTELSLLLERFWMGITNHFTHEEAVMREQGYPLLDAHAAAHAKFLGELADLRHACVTDDAEAPTRWTIRYLETWFARHALTHDAQLARWLDTSARPTTATGAPARP